jgi:hypothetical protein
LKKAGRSGAGGTQISVSWVARPCISIALGAVVASVFERTQCAGAALAVITLWSLGFVPVQVVRFSNTFHNSADMGALWLLPVGDNEIFQWLLHKSLRGTLWLLLDLVCAFLMLAFQGGIPCFLWIVAVLLAITAWAQVLALALLAVVYLPRFPFALASTAFLVSTAVLFLGRGFLAEPVMSVLVTAQSTLNLVLPTGWPGALFLALLLDHQWLFILLVIPIVLTLHTAWKNLAFLRSLFHPQEPLLAESHDVPLEESRVEAPSQAMNVPLRAGPTEIEEIILSRMFLRQPVWPESSRIGRLLWRWYTPRERRIVEFAFPDGMDIWKSWKPLFRNLAITTAGTYITTALASPEAGHWVLAVGLFLTGSHVLGILNLSGQAFQKIVCGGINIPLYAGFGIGFRELAGTLLKTATIQFPFVLPYCLVACVLALQAFGESIGAGVVIGMKMSILVTLSCLILIPMQFSAGTNDTSRVRLRSLLMLLTFLVFCLGFLGLGAAAIFAPDWPIAWTCLAASGIVAGGFFRVYALFHESNTFDLMNVPQS